MYTRPQRTSVSGLVSYGFGKTWTRHLLMVGISWRVYYVFMCWENRASNSEIIDVVHRLSGHKSSRAKHAKRLRPTHPTDFVLVLFRSFWCDCGPHLATREQQYPHVNYLLYIYIYIIEYSMRLIRVINHTFIGGEGIETYCFKLLIFMDVGWTLNNSSIPNIVYVGFKRTR
jgi:hypothetical protein